MEISLNELMSALGKSTQDKCGFPIAVGEKIFIRTVTFYYTGRITKITNDMICITEAAWIPDTGRFSDAMKSGVFSEVEPYPDSFEVLVSRGAIVDCCNWVHSLPREKK